MCVFSRARACMHVYVLFAKLTSKYDLERGLVMFLESLKQLTISVFQPMPFVHDDVSA